jgi:hypothetical protein
MGNLRAWRVTAAIFQSRQNVTLVAKISTNEVDAYRAAGCLASRIRAFQWVQQDSGQVLAERAGSFGEPGHGEAQGAAMAPVRLEERQQKSRRWAGFSSTA